eukprot:13598056-Alexandrium_andersonii.AAC.1
MPDIRFRMGLPGGEAVHFDNASHSNGRQRAFIACGCPAHSACFKYTTVDLHPSPAHAAAT